MANEFGKADKGSRTTNKIKFLSLIGHCTFFICMGHNMETVDHFIYLESVVFLQIFTALSPSSLFVQNQEMRLSEYQH